MSPSNYPALLKQYMYLLDFAIHYQIKVTSILVRGVHAQIQHYWA